MRVKHRVYKKPARRTKKLIIGNWKMYPGSIAEAKKIFNTFKKQKHQNTGVTTVICPPFVYLNELKRMYTGEKIFFGAQDCFIKSEGAYTGEISAEMITNLRCRFVILGHSERRAIGESSKLIAKKVKHALKAGLHVVLCVGEVVRDEHGEYLRFVEGQLKESLEGIPRDLTKRLVIAYEPIWAIGKGHKAMEAREVEQMTLFLRKLLIKKYGRKVGENIPVLYGGSADSDNAHVIVDQSGVDGLLVGRKSLDPYEFSKIIDTVSRG